MSYPSPDDLAQAPSWDNYIVAQCIQAMLGIIPPNTLAIAVSVDRTNVGLHFQMSDLNDEDQEDIADIESYLLSLVGSGVDVAVTTDVVEQRDRDRYGKVRWLYIRHD